MRPREEVECEGEVCACHGSSAEEKQWSAPHALHEEAGDAGKDDLRRHGHHRGKFGVLHVGLLADGRGVHHDGVDPADLLESQQADAHDERPLVAKKARRARASRFSRRGCLRELCDLHGDVAGAEPAQRGAGSVGVATARVPLRRVRHEKHRQQWPRQAEAKHCEPWPIAPQLPVMLNDEAVAAHDAHHQDAQGDGQLVRRAERSTKAHGGDFADVARRYCAPHADTDAAQHPQHAEEACVPRQGCA
mmetsp:Transcript_128928/g.360742  ORF Transcript_128928/g.360742 Transcript_128928/m.360742 type:complete len:248 (+) Transcript_128928:369-1112(+)